MLTLHDVARTAEAQRRFPNWIIWVMVIAAVVWAIGSVVDAFPWQGSGNVSAPAVSQPVAERLQAPLQNVQENVAAAPITVSIWLNWQEEESLGFEYYAWGKDENGVIYDVRYGAAGRIIGTGRTKDTVVYLRAGNPIQFSPDQVLWIEPANLPAVPSGYAEIKGAAWDGDDILIIANYQYEPWKYRGYVARVTPEDMKRASH